MAINFSNLRKSHLEILGKTIKSEFDENEKLRDPYTQEWLQSLRQLENVYDPDATAKMSQDEPKMYPGYTRSKVVPLKAKLTQYLIPEKEKNWGFQPSPIPLVNQKTLDYIVDTLAATMVDEEGNSIPLTEEIIGQAITEYTKEKSEKMSLVISDQLLDDKYKHKQKIQLDAGIDYGTGIIKGPFSESYEQVKIVQDRNTGVWKQTTKKQYRPVCENVMIWNFFPDMASVELDQCRFVDFLYSKTKHEMRKLAEREDFFGEVIESFLRKHPKGNYKLRDWEIIAQTMSSITAPSRETENYEVVERNCFIDGWQLFELGIEKVEDVNESYFCNVWLLGSEIIKIALWTENYTKHSDLCHLFYYDKNETSIFGKGLPKIIRNPQLGMAACQRHMLRNASWVAGPSGEINIEYLHPDFIKDAAKMHPGKFHVRFGRGNDANVKIMSFYNVNSHITDILAIKKDFKEQGDNDSSLPSYLFGDQTPQTAGTPLGTSKMMFASLVDFIKSLVRSFDEAHKSYLNSVYKWNMEFNPDESIKGDMQPQTAGSAIALVKEIENEQIAFLLQSLSAFEEIKPWIKWGNCAKVIFKNRFPADYENLIKSDEEYDRDMQESALKQQEIENLQKILMQIKGEYDLAKAEHMKAKAEKTSAEIPHGTEGKAIENELKRMQMAEKGVSILRGLTEEKQPNE